MLYVVIKCGCPNGFLLKNSYLLPTKNIENTTIKQNQGQTLFWGLAYRECRSRHTIKQYSKHSEATALANRARGEGPK